MTFRENFYWGNSVSSMQTEGAWNAEGKGKSVYDIKEATEFSSDWKVATDSYHRYEEDFDYMQDLGMNMYRFQISWSRVNPTGDGAFNEAGIEFYDRFIDSLISRGIEPMICLYHFDMPLHLAEKYNGFLSKEVVSAFSRYGIEMIKRFGHKVKHWITFNEQNAFCLITDSGTVPEETLYFKRPCITIRESTERPETIEAGANILSGLEPSQMLKAVETITSQEPSWEWNDALGDGKTARKIINILQGKLY